MRLARDGPQDSQSLRRDLNAVLTEQLRRVSSHALRIDRILDLFKYLIFDACLPLVRHEQQQTGVGLAIRKDILFTASVVS
jgi:hypothetical protein